MAGDAPSPVGCFEACITKFKKSSKVQHKAHHERARAKLEGRPFEIGNSERKYYMQHALLVPGSTSAFDRTSDEQPGGHLFT